MTEPRFYGRIDDEARFYGLPFDGIVSSEFGEIRSRTDLSGETVTWPHSGVDIAPLWLLVDGKWVANTNMPLRAPCPLKITLLWDDPDNPVKPAIGLGRWVLGETPEGWQVLFAHLERIDVSIRDVVPRGATLGITGTTGNSTGIHTHVMVIEPLDGQPPDWKERPGRRDYLDYVTESVDPGEPWPSAAEHEVPEVGDETPIFTTAEWERVAVTLVNQAHMGFQGIDITPGLVEKRNRYHVELDIAPGVIED